MASVDINYNIYIVNNPTDNSNSSGALKIGSGTLSNVSVTNGLNGTGSVELKFAVPEYKGKCICVDANVSKSYNDWLDINTTGTGKTSTAISSGKGWHKVAIGTQPISARQQGVCVWSVEDKDYGGAHEFPKASTYDFSISSTNKALLNPTAPSSWTSSSSTHIKENTVTLSPLLYEGGSVILSFNVSNSDYLFDEKSISFTISASTFTCTLNNEGKTSNQTVTYGQTPSSFTVPTKQYYDFQGWFLDSTEVISHRGEPIANTTLFDANRKWKYKSDVTLTAKYVGKEYTISLQSNRGNVFTSGENAVPSSIKYQYGTAKNGTLTSKPTAYTTVYFTSNGDNVNPIQANRTFNGFVDSTNTVILQNGSYNWGREQFKSSTDIQASWSGGSITLPTPTKTGYTFLGWYSDASLTTLIGEAGKSWTPTWAAPRLYGKWSINSYYLDLNGYIEGTTIGSYTATGNINGSATADVYIGGSKIQTAITDYYAQHNYGTSYKFVLTAANGWQYDGMYSGALEGTIPASTIYVAPKLTRKVIKVTCKDGVNDDQVFYYKYGATNGNGKKYFSNQALTNAIDSIQARTKPNYILNGYKNGSTTYINSSGVISDSLYTAFTSDVTLTASYSGAQYNVGIGSANATNSTYSNRGDIFTSGVEASPTNITYTYGTEQSGTLTSKPTAYTTVTFNVDGGSTVGTNNTMKAERTFNGFYTAPSGGAKKISADKTYIWDISEFANNTTLYAQWSGGSITLPKPTRTNYTFEGWYKESTFTNFVGIGDSSYTPHKANPTLYAKWQALNFTVTYISNGGNPPTKIQTVTYGNKFKTYGGSSDPDMDDCFYQRGYHLDYWSGSLNGTYLWGTEATVTYGYTSNTTVYGKWSPIQYSIIYFANYGENFSMTDRVLFNDLFRTRSEYEFSRPGYRLGGWSASPSGSIVYSEEQESRYQYVSDIRLYAQWTPNTYQVAYNKNGGSGSSTPSYVTFGESWTTKTLAQSGFWKTGYSLSEWCTKPTTTASGAVRYELGQTVAQYNNVDNTTLYAIWSANEYNIVYIRDAYTRPVSIQANYGMFVKYDGKFTALVPYSTSAVGFKYDVWKQVGGTKTIKPNTEYTFNNFNGFDATDMMFEMTFVSDDNRLYLLYNYSIGNGTWVFDYDNKLMSFEPWKTYDQVFLNQIKDNITRFGQHLPNYQPIINEFHSLENFRGIAFYNYDSELEICTNLNSTIGIDNYISVNNINNLQSTIPLFFYESIEYGNKRLTQVIPICYLSTSNSIYVGGIWRDPKITIDSFNSGTRIMVVKITRLTSSSPSFSSAFKKFVQRHLIIKLNNTYRELIYTDENFNETFQGISYSMNGKIKFQGYANNNISDCFGVKFVSESNTTITDGGISYNCKQFTYQILFNKGTGDFNVWANDTVVTFTN